MIKSCLKVVPLLLLAAFFATGLFMSKKAHASDLFLGQLYSVDGGPSSWIALPPSTPGALTSSNATGQKFHVWCNIPSCIKTDIVTGSPTDGGWVGDGGILCSVDVPAWTYPTGSLANNNSPTCSGIGTIPECVFVGGKHLGIIAMAFDAGNPACNVSAIIGGM